MSLASESGLGSGRSCGVVPIERDSYTVDLFNKVLSLLSFVCYLAGEGIDGRELAALRSSVGRGVGFSHGRGCTWDEGKGV